MPPKLIPRIFMTMNTHWRMILAVLLPSQDPWKGAYMSVQKPQCCAISCKPLANPTPLFLCSKTWWARLPIQSLATPAAATHADRDRMGRRRAGPRGVVGGVRRRRRPAAQCASCARVGASARRSGRPCRRRAARRRRRRRRVGRGLGRGVPFLAPLR